MRRAPFEPRDDIVTLGKLTQVCFVETPRRLRHQGGMKGHGASSFVDFEARGIVCAIGPLRRGSFVRTLVLVRTRTSTCSWWVLATASSAFERPVPRPARRQLVRRACAGAVRQAVTPHVIPGAADLKRDKKEQDTETYQRHPKGNASIFLLCPTRLR